MGHEQGKTEAEAKTKANEKGALMRLFINILTIVLMLSAPAWARLEIKPVSQAYFRPVAQNFASSDGSGLAELVKNPFLIVPANSDVRIAVKANTSGVKVACGFSGYLAKVIN